MKKIFLLYTLICFKAFTCEPPPEYEKEYVKTSAGVYYVIKSYDREISRKQLPVKKKNKFVILKNDDRVAYDGQKIYLDGVYESAKASSLFALDLKKSENSIHRADFRTLKVVFMPGIYEKNKMPVHKDKNSVYFNYEKKNINSVDIKSFEAVEELDESFIKDPWRINNFKGLFFKDKKLVYYKDKALEGSDPKKSIIILAAFDGKKENDINTVIFFPCNDYIEDTQVYSSNNNNIYYKDRKISGADKESFAIEKKNVFYSRDKNFVYFMGEKQEKIDNDTFEMLSYRYSKDKNHVYRNNRIFDGTDPDSFVILDDNYVKDKNSVYFENLKIDLSDPETFIIMKYRYSKDKNFAYKEGKRIDGADGASFTEIQEISGRVYHKDRENVYLKGVKIDGADPETFMAVNHEYSKDKKNVYREGKNIGKRDSETFKPLNYYEYTEDKNNVYYGDKEIKGIDRKYFEVVDGPYSKDRKYIYYKTQRVNEADVNNFRIIEDTIYYDNSYYRDNNNVFFQGRLLKGANPDKFKRLGEYTFYYYDGTHLYYDGVRMDSVDYNTLVIYDGIDYSKDKNHVYFENRILENADSATFREIKSKKRGRYVMDKNHVYDNEGNINENIKVEDLEQEK